MILVERIVIKEKILKKILVTGGAGFLGSHLCKRLIDVGDEVFCVDNLSTSSKSNIGGLLNHKNFHFIMHDITQPLYINVDEIYNLACPASPPLYQKDPIHTTKTCIIGSLNMLGLAKRNKAKIFQASTSEVYGDPEMHPQIEEYRGSVDTTSIRSCYDEGKRCAETLFFDYKRQHETDIKIARIFNTYGPQMDVNDGRVVSNFITQALQNKPITIYGDGYQTRSLCYVDDMIDGFLALMGSDKYITGPINLGNPTELMVLQIAEKIVELTNSKSEFAFVELPKDDPQKRKPNISKARFSLGWEPKVSLEEGLLKTIEYFEKKLGEK